MKSYTPDKEELHDVLRFYEFHRGKVAEHFGFSRRKLYQLIRKYEIPILEHDWRKTARNPIDFKECILLIKKGYSNIDVSRKIGASPSHVRETVIKNVGMEKYLEIRERASINRAKRHKELGTYKNVGGFKERKEELLLS